MTSRIVHLRRILVMAGLLNISLIAPSSFGTQQDDEVIPRPDVRVGEYWTYRVTDRVGRPDPYAYRTTVTFVGPDVILTMNTFPNDAEKEQDGNWTREWNARALGRGDVFKPYVGLLKFPLRIGSNYDSKYVFEATRGGMVRSETELSVRVIGWEEISVPIGKFRAIKLEIATSYFVPSTGVRGMTNQKMWYVPAVKRWVRYELKNSRREKAEIQELLDFHVK